VIFYLAIDGADRTCIVGTQADAHKINQHFQQIDIPTDKAGLMDWVQQMLDETLNACDQPAEASKTEAELEYERQVAKAEAVKPVPTIAPMDPPLGKILTVAYIQDWLLNDANQRQIERIYNAIGCRVGEILRDAREPVDED
jgi:hypothetical protein